MTTIRPTLAICMFTGAVAAVGLFAPGGSDDDAAATSGRGNTVEIENFDFTASPVLEPGAAVEVINLDGVAHTLTSTEQLFSTGTLDPDAGVAITLPVAAGTYAYFCELHPSMTGSFTIGAAAAPETTVAGASPDPTVEDSVSSGATIP